MKPQERICACDCDQLLPEGLRADARYINDSHGRCARRARQERAETPGTVEHFWDRIRRLQPRARPRRVRAVKTAA